MNNRRRAIAGLLAVSLLSLGAAACGSDGTGSSPADSETAAAQADPKQALLDSTKALGEGNFEYTMAGDGMTGEGIVHLPSRSAQMSLRFVSDDLEMKMDMVYVEPDSWVKLDLGELGNLPGMEKLSGKYLHLDQSKIKDVEGLQFDLQDVDPAGSALIMKAITDVRKAGEGAFTGTADLTKATDASMVGEELVKTLGIQANALPFEAKLDPQGRLAELTIKVPVAGEAKAYDLTITYSNYGTVTAVQKPPASETIEAPAETYDMFK